MSKENSINTKRNQNTSYKLGVGSKEDYRDRRFKEMKRRVGVLKSRKSYLEHELKAVKACLFSLDQQMQNYTSFKQLSM